MYCISRIPVPVPVPVGGYYMIMNIHTVHISYVVNFLPQTAGRRSEKNRWPTTERHIAKTCLFGLDDPRLDHGGPTMAVRYVAYLLLKPTLWWSPLSSERSLLLDLEVYRQPIHILLYIVARRRRYGTYSLVQAWCVWSQLLYVEAYALGGSLPSLLLICWKE